MDVGGVPSPLHARVPSPFTGFALSEAAFFARAGRVLRAWTKQFGKARSCRAGREVVLVWLGDTLKSKRVSYAEWVQKGLGLVPLSCADSHIALFDGRLKKIVDPTTAFTRAIYNTPWSNSLPVLYALTSESQFTEHGGEDGRFFYTPMSDDDLYSTTVGTAAQFKKVGLTNTFDTAAYHCAVHDFDASGGQKATFLLCGRQWPRMVVPRPEALRGGVFPSTVLQTCLDSQMNVCESLTSYSLDLRVKLALQHLSSLTEEGLLSLPNKTWTSFYVIQQLLRASWIVTKSIWDFESRRVLPGEAGLGSSAFAAEPPALSAAAKKKHDKRKEDVRKLVVEQVKRRKRARPPTLTQLELSQQQCAHVLQQYLLATRSTRTRRETVLTSRNG